MVRHDAVKVAETGLFDHPTGGAVFVMYVVCVEYCAMCETNCCSSKTEIIQTTRTIPGQVYTQVSGGGNPFGGATAIASAGSPFGGGASAFASAGGYPFGFGSNFGFNNGGFNNCGFNNGGFNNGGFNFGLGSNNFGLNFGLNNGGLNFGLDFGGLNFGFGLNGGGGYF